MTLPWYSGLQLLPSYIDDPWSPASTLVIHQHLSRFHHCLLLIKTKNSKRVQRQCNGKITARIQDIHTYDDQVEPSDALLPLDHHNTVSSPVDMTKLRFCVIFTIILVSFKIQSRPCINVVNYAHEDSVIKIIIFSCDPQHLHHPRLRRQTFLGDNNTPIIKYDPDNEVRL